MKITDLTFMGFQLVGVLDAGHSGSISVEQVKRELENGDIFAFLK